MIAEVKDNKISLSFLLKSNNPILKQSHFVAVIINGLKCMGKRDRKQGKIAFIQTTVNKSLNAMLQTFGVCKYKNIAI